jgi:hypothetical protein
MPVEKLGKLLESFRYHIDGEELVFTVDGDVSLLEPAKRAPPGFHDHFLRLPQPAAM